MRLAEWWRIRPFFDAPFYLRRYPDVRQSGMNPLRHYLRHGIAEGRKPHPLFDPAYYQSDCPEARNAANPLLHFIDTGGRLGNPHPLFDCAAYLTANPDAAERQTHPLLHYIRHHRVPKPPTLEILDVEVSFEENAAEGPIFKPEPQQRRFFRAIRQDQLASQIK
jgi:hypothetical protein